MSDWTPALIVGGVILLAAAATLAYGLASISADAEQRWQDILRQRQRDLEREQMRAQQRETVDV